MNHGEAKARSWRGKESKQTEEQANGRTSKQELPRPGRAVTRQPFQNTPSPSLSRSSESLLELSPDSLWWDYSRQIDLGSEGSHLAQQGVQWSERQRLINRHSSGGPGPAEGAPQLLPHKKSSSKTAAFTEIKALVGEVASGDTSSPLPWLSPFQHPPRPGTLTLPRHPPPDLTKIAERFQTKDVLCLREGGEKAKFIMKACCL